MLDAAPALAADGSSAPLWQCPLGWYKSCYSMDGKSEPSLDYVLSFGAKADLGGSGGDESHGFSLISSCLCDMKHFLRTAEQQSVLWMQLKLISVYRSC